MRKSIVIGCLVVGLIVTLNHEAQAKGWGSFLARRVPFAGPALEAASLACDPTAENAAGCAGAYGGAYAGGYAGATIGTAICPGPGTIIGGTIGSIGGGIVGDKAGRAVLR